MTQTVYTQDVITALTASMVDGTHTYFTTKEFAGAYGYKHRSVIAKVKQLDQPYLPKPRLTKSGTAVVRKADLVATIALRVGLAADKLETLEKASKASLEALVAVLAQPEDEGA